MLKFPAPENRPDPSAPSRTRACLILSRDTRFCRPSSEWNRRRRRPQVLPASSLPRRPLSPVLARASSSGAGLGGTGPPPGRWGAGAQVAELLVVGAQARTAELLPAPHGRAAACPARPSCCEAGRAPPADVHRPSRSVIFFNLQQS
jgi:hypothetical protein